MFAGCDQYLKPELQVIEIRKEVTFDTRVPYYLGKVKNYGNKEALFAEIEIIVYANESKGGQIAISKDYIGNIAPGETKTFRVYFFYLHSSTDISNYDIKFDYEY